MSVAVLLCPCGIGRVRLGLGQGIRLITPPAWGQWGLHDLSGPWSPTPAEPQSFKSISEGTRRGHSATWG